MLLLPRCVTNNQSAALVQNHVMLSPGPMQRRRFFMALPVLMVAPGFGYPAGTQLQPVAVPCNITCQAFAIAPATKIQDGSGGTNPIQFAVDGGPPQNVNLNSVPGTQDPNFSIPLTPANTGGAGGARLGHSVVVTIQDDVGGQLAATLTVLRTN
jgi:hypothetical protein